MFEQYLRIKQDYPGALLFYRMGDFYELFFEDAEIAARELSIALTSRNPGADSPVPMCGVPHHAAEVYLTKLLGAATRWHLRQVEDPRQAKGLVKRAVAGVLTRHRGWRSQPSGQGLTSWPPVATPSPGGAMAGWTIHRRLGGWPPGCGPLWLWLEKAVPANCSCPRARSLRGTWARAAST
jgi:hypothetical protein